ncbi:MFS transporter [Hydrogenophaga sp. 5NK40-0174]|uniref:MFS transporter n=1 Tax=Hydrogenophaga sp. 5NK40-0174 TaxID=3127649 RepID=UPI003108B9F0
MPETASNKSTPTSISTEDWKEDLYELLTAEDEARLCRDIPDSQCSEQPDSFLRQVLSQALSKTGDVLADAKIVLPWLLGVVGAPGYLVGMLVPIRESLSLLPQMLVGGWIRHFEVRKGFWAVASLVEGLCVLLMGALAWSGVLDGAVAGWAMLALLAIFSLSRGVASIAAKDTLGKTVSKGRRGRVSGYAATASGLVGGAVGLLLLLQPSVKQSDSWLGGMILGAGLCWVLAALVYWGIREHPGATDGGRGLGDLVKSQMQLLLRERPLQWFLLARGLMISTALVGPVYVGMAQSSTGESLATLGGLMVASGLAGTLSSSFWGVWSDASSRLTMAAGALIAAVLGVLVWLAQTAWPQATEHMAFYAVVMFILGVAHAGVRIGRKTQLVDMAGKDNRTDYVAVSNTLIGVALLVIGAGVSVVIGFSAMAGILLLSAMAAAGAFIAWRLPDAQA